MLKPLLFSLALATTIAPSIAAGFSFPEIDFCPLGGPPGWFNRFTGQHNNGPYNNGYFPPPPAMQPGYGYYPPVAPYGWQPPAMSPAARYFQGYPRPGQPQF